MCIVICTLCVLCPLGQKRVLEPLELKLQRVVSRHVGAGSRTQAVCKSHTCP